MSTENFESVTGRCSQAQPLKNLNCVVILCQNHTHIYVNYLT